jgi:hypothetical protein
LFRFGHLTRMPYVADFVIPFRLSKPYWNEFARLSSAQTPFGVVDG